MRVLLAANASYAPPRGGATRSNLAWLDHLACAGHQCRIIAGESQPGAVLPVHESVCLTPVAQPAARVEALRREIREFSPDWVMISSEDLAHGLLREAHHRAPGRVVYVAHTPQFFPFGREAWNLDRHAAEAAAEAAGIIVVGRKMAAYVQAELRRTPQVIHPPIYGGGPYASAAFPRGFVTMFNPCAVKGISIFAALAQRMPACGFGAVAGWGTTAEDRRLLDGLPNVQWLPNARRIDDILSRTCVLVVPSLWYEGFGLIVVEAMLRGIPVVASDRGGLPEAKLDTNWVIPVNGIERYQPVFDDQHMPRPVLPPNDVEPWADAIAGLTRDGALWRRESESARAAAEDFAGRLCASDLEDWLGHLEPFTGAHGAPASIESLSPLKRALLLRRLRQRKLCT